MLETENAKFFFKKGKILDFTIETSIDFLKKANYLINSPKFRGQPIFKKAKFGFFGLEKAEPGNRD